MLLQVAMRDIGQLTYFYVRSPDQPLATMSFPPGNPVRSAAGGGISSAGRWPCQAGQGSGKDAAMDEGPPQVVIDTSKAHPARVYDYWLGGKDNFAADREAAELALQAYPQLAQAVQANRKFLARAVQHLTREAGVRQFLDLGTGIPAADNTHQVAQREAPESRIVYVDNDPIVLLHAAALLRSPSPGICDYIEADLRDPDAILARAAETLDFTQPVALMLLAILQFIPDEEDPLGLVSTLLDALPSGSYLAISHPTDDFNPNEQGESIKRYNERVTDP